MKTKILFLTIPILIIAGLLIGFNISAQDEDVTAEDLGISEPKTLPSSPFYFLKDFWRQVRLVFTFSAVKKAELRLQFANEMLVEAKVLAEEVDDQELFQRAIEKYQAQMERVQDQVEKLETKPDNSKLNKLTDSLTQKMRLQGKLLDQFEEKIQNENTLERLKEVRENVLERTKERIQSRIENLQQEAVQEMNQERIEEQNQGEEAQSQEQNQVQEQKRAICIAQWAPVCGKDGKTYSNACFLNNAGVEMDYKGECQTSPETRNQAPNKKGK